MSLIHVLSRTTKSEKEFLQAGLSDCSLVLVETETKVESFSIELTVGAIWSNRYDTTDNAMFAIPREGIDIPVGGSVVVEVAEKIRVPHNMYGLIIPTGRLFLDRGIIIAAAKIEPSFNDRLKLRMVNVSGSKRSIGPGQKIASAIFFSTERTVYHDEVRKGAVVATKPVARGKKLAKWCSENRNQLVTWALAGSALVVATLSYLDKRVAVAPDTTAISHSAEQSSVIPTNATDVSGATGVGNAPIINSTGAVTNTITGR